MSARRLQSLFCLSGAVLACLSVCFQACAEKAPSVELIFGVDLTTGELVTAGEVEVDDAGLVRTRQTFVKDGGKRVWKLQPGDALVLVATVPTGLDGYVLWVDEVGWVRAAKGESLTIGLNGDQSAPLPAAEPCTLKLHRIPLPKNKLVAGKNEFVIANHAGGVLGIRGVRLLAGPGLAGGAAKPSPGSSEPSAETTKPEPPEATKPPTGNGDSGKPVTEAPALSLTSDEKKEKLTALHKAAKLGDESALEALLANGADTAALTTKKWTALHFAAAEGHLDCVNELIEAGIDIDRRSGAMGGGWATPLFLAAKGGHVDVVRALLKQGANPDAAAMFSWTPLHIAVARDNAEVVQVLLDNGAKPNALTDSQESPFHMAAKRGNVDILKALIESKKVDKNGTTNMGATALHLAAEGGHEEAVKYCVHIGIPINAMDRNGRTATDLANPDFAAKYRSVKDVSGHAACFKYLRSKGGKHAWELKKK